MKAKTKTVKPKKTIKAMAKIMKGLPATLARCKKEGWHDEQKAGKLQLCEEAEQGAESRPSARRVQQVPTESVLPFLV